MDMNQLNALTDEQKTEYLELSRLFQEPGWKRLVEYFEQKEQAMLMAAANANSWEDNRIACGLRTAYQEFINMEDTTYAVYTSISEAATEEQHYIEEEEFE